MISTLAAAAVCGCSQKNTSTPAPVDHAKVWEQENHAGLDSLAKNDLTGAESHLLIALKEGEACGADDPRVAGALTNLASVYEKKEMYAQAIPLLKRAIAIFQTKYGAKSKFVMVVAGDLGRVSAKAGQYNEAEAAYKRSVELWRAQKSAEAKDVLSGYADVLKKLDKSDEAKAVEQEAAALK